MEKNKYKTEDYRQFIIYIMQSINCVIFTQNTPEQGITVSFLRKMLSSAETVLKLDENGYDACIIASHMAEGIILLNWLLDDSTRIKDYNDYMFIEFLSVLEIDNSHKEQLLDIIKQKKIQRFLKTNKKEILSDENLLNPKNYRNYWYQLTINTLSDIPSHLKFEVSQKALKDIYIMYQKLCSYKHYSPCVMPSQDDISSKWRTRPTNVALRTTALCLYMTLLYANQFQYNTLDIADIMSRYDQLFEK